LVGRAALSESCRIAAMVSIQIAAMAAAVLKLNLRASKVPEDV
jgi:hypothetical protein